MADRNFPVHSLGVPVVAARGTESVDVIAAILSVFPLDDHAGTRLERMRAADGSDTLNLTHNAVLAFARLESYPRLEFGVIPRFEFYE